MYCSLSPSLSLSLCRWWSKPVNEVEFSTPASIKPDLSCSEAIKLFKDEGVDYIPVLGKFG